MNREDAKEEPPCPWGEIRKKKKIQGLGFGDVPTLPEYR
jgi:hypothetical protein